MVNPMASKWAFSLTPAEFEGVHGNGFLHGIGDMMQDFNATPNLPFQSHRR
jgi:hypothetical protein